MKYVHLNIINLNFIYHEEIIDSTPFIYWGT